MGFVGLQSTTYRVLRITGVDKSVTVDRSKILHKNVRRSFGAQNAGIEASSWSATRAFVDGSQGRKASEVHEKDLRAA